MTGPQQGCVQLVIDIIVGRVESTAVKIRDQEYPSRAESGAHRRISQ